MSAVDHLRSSRLVYRAPEEADKDGIYRAITTDPVGWRNANFGLPKPQGKDSWEGYYKYTTEGCLIACVICIPPSEGQTDLTPIGLVHLHKPDERSIRNRCSSIGIEILKDYQGKGYGTEALRWIINFGFEYAGLHRIEIGAFEYNSGAIRLYERLGFVHECVKREMLWYKGKFWDVIELAMLEREWLAIREKLDWT